MNTLFTSVGRRVELVRCFRKAYESLGTSGRIVATDIDPLAPALQVVDKAYMVPRVSEPAYISAILNVCRAEHIDVVFPLIDPDIPVLAQHESMIREAGARLAVVSEHASKVAADKTLTSSFFESLGLKTPHIYDDDAVTASDFPLFIKPASGSAGEGSFVVRTRRELEFFRHYVDRPIVQEFISGPEITTDVGCGLDGTVFAIVSRQRISVRGGEVAKGVTVIRQDVQDACLHIVEELPVRGPVTVQCILKDDIPYFTEINARLGGGVPLAIAAGADIPRWLIADAAGLPIDAPSLGNYRTGLSMTRFDSSFFVSEQQRDAIASCYL